MKIKKEEFLSMYKTKTVREICSKYNISAPTVYRLLKKAGAELKRNRETITFLD